MVIKNYLIDGKNYSSFTGDFNSDHLCLEVNFTSISDNLVIGLNKVLEKYQIKITQYLNGNYIKFFFEKENIELSEMSHKLNNGYNKNEVLLVPKNIDNQGIFEKFFNIFS